MTLGNMKLGVVVPVVNQFELAVKALESVNVGDTDWQPFIVDNWSENKGVAAAWNAGTKDAISAGCDYILIINDDIVLSPWTPKHMINLMSINTDIGVLSGTDHRNSLQPDQVRHMKFPNYEVEFLDAPDFACFMITPKTYNHIGEFDTNFHPAYFEDNDYCHRTIVSGLKCVRSQNAAFYHYGSKTQNHNGQVVPSPIFLQNRAYFVRKWGGLPGRESFVAPFNNPNLDWRSTNPG